MVLGVIRFLLRTSEFLLRLYYLITTCYYVVLFFITVLLEIASIHCFVLFPRGSPGPGNLILKLPGRLRRPGSSRRRSRRSRRSPEEGRREDQKRISSRISYSKDRDDRTPLLTFRTYQILPNTNSYFHCLYYSYLDLLQQLLGYQGGALPPLGYPRGPWGRRSR